MILQLKRLFERAGDQKDIGSEIPLEELGEFVGCGSFVTPISLSGKVQNIAGMVSLDYSAEVTVRRQCDRCLDEFDREYRFGFSHILSRDESSLNDESVFCPGGVLNMNELVISDLLVELPTKAVCRDDCKGLCPRCGKNLNHGSCGCDLPAAVGRSETEF